MYRTGTVQWKISGDTEKARRELTGLALKWLHHARDAKHLGNFGYFDTGWKRYPQGNIRVVSNLGTDTVYMDAIGGGGEKEIIPDYDLFVGYYVRNEESYTEEEGYEYGVIVADYKTLKPKGYVPKEDYLEMPEVKYSETPGYGGGYQNPNCVYTNKAAEITCAGFYHDDFTMICSPYEIGFGLQINGQTVKMLIGASIESGNVVMYCVGDSQRAGHIRTSSHNRSGIAAPGIGYMSYSDLDGPWVVHKASASGNLFSIYYTENFTNSCSQRYEYTYDGYTSHDIAYDQNINEDTTLTIMWKKTGEEEYIVEEIGRFIGTQTGSVDKYGYEPNPEVFTGKWTGKFLRFGLTGPSSVMTCYGAATAWIYYKKDIEQKDMEPRKDKEVLLWRKERVNLALNNFRASDWTWQNMQGAHPHAISRPGGTIDKLVYGIIYHKGENKKDASIEFDEQSTYPYNHYFNDKCDSTGGAEGKYFDQKTMKLIRIPISKRKKYEKLVSYAFEGKKIEQEVI